MIIDKIENISLYSKLGEKITKALQFLKETDFSGLEPGRQEISGLDVFANLNSYETKSENPWEAHRQYIDIHFLPEGKEKMGYANVKQLKVVKDYDPGKDILFLEGEGDYFKLEKGKFAIFFPQDAHIPGLTIDNPQTVKKVVVKVKAE